MLNKLRNFSKGKLAGVLVGIIIIPFVFWGMGSVFSGGNTNSIAKINNHNLSTKDFSDFINNSKISSKIIKENINNNVLEELLTQLISTSLINIEIDKLQFSISDEILAKKIRKEKNFQDENKNFSRTKYEKFLLENNTSSVQFEKGIKDNELKKKLFVYLGGGIKSPFFLINKTYKEQIKNIEVDYINLNSIYIKKDEFTLEDLKKHINKNKDKFLLEKIDISYIKISPENISGDTEFTENFFSKIDEIEELIINKKNIIEIAKKYNLTIKNINDYSPGKDNENLLNEIYKKRNENVIELLDKNDFFLLYEVKNFKKVTPSLEDSEFLLKVKNDLYQSNKYDLNKDLLIKISKKEFTNNDFNELSKNSINNLKISSIKDVNKFTPDSIKLLYSLSLNSFSLVSDKENNVYLAKIIKIDENNLSSNNKDLKKFINQTNISLRNSLYNSYDLLLNEKYKININENTLDRMKNYFR